MKYKNYSIFKNLIAFVLMLALALSFCACTQDSSGDESSNSVPAFNAEIAAELVRRDKTVTGIFLCNALCGEEDIADYTAVSEDSQYSSYADIKNLLAATYYPDGGDAQFFLNYPDVGEKAVTERNGKSFVYKHAGSGYYDFVQPESITVDYVSGSTKAVINAKTESGRDVTLKAVYHNGSWLLEHGIYKTVGLEPYTNAFGLSDLGSFKQFTGKVLVIELFVSDREIEFTKEDERKFHQKVKTAVDFITEESKRFNNEVSVTYKPAYFEHDGVLGTKPLDFNIVFAETGFGSLDNFAESLCDLSEYDNYVFAVCINREGESTEYHAYNGNNETKIYFGERVYLNVNSTEYEICVSLLKLLGANNFADTQYSDYVRALFNSYFPNEVLIKNTLENATLSSVTAYACGITSELDPLYRVFDYE